MPNRTVQKELKHWLWHVSGGECERRGIRVRLGRNSYPISTMPDVYHRYGKQGVTTDCGKVCPCIKFDYDQRKLNKYSALFFHGSTVPSGPGFLVLRILYRTQTRHICRTPLDERSARRKELNLITHNTHKRQTFMTPVEFEPAIPARELPQTQTAGPPGFANTLY